MKRRSTGLAPAMIALSVALGAAGLAGCSAGQITQTATQSSGADGYQGQAGAILLRNASIAYAGQANGPIYRAGQSAQLQLTIVNSGTQTDKLLSVSSPWAASAQVQGDGVLPAGRAVQVGTPPTPGEKSLGITLNGLKNNLLAGPNYPVTFTFQRGGVLQAQLPIGYPTGAVAVRDAAN